MTAKEKFKYVYAEVMNFACNMPLLLIFVMGHV